MQDLCDEAVADYHERIGRLCESCERHGGRAGAAALDPHPQKQVIPFGASEAGLAADLYRRVKTPRGREIDLAIAATCIARDAALWTLNEADFRDIPGLDLVGGA